MSLHFQESYNGNPHLRPAGIKIDWTLDQIREWQKCKDDPIYFVETYVKIITLDYGLQPMKPYEFQKEIITKALNSRRVIVKCARQAGKTTTASAFLLHYIIFNELKTAAILANKASTAREILGKVTEMYESLPRWIQHGIKEWNKGSIELENGSRVLASSTSSSAIRGFTINLLVLDEFAFLHQNLADEFFTSVYPTISSGQQSKLIIVSTPNGMNHFYKMWNEAVSGINGMEYIDAKWDAVPWRDQKWADEQRAVLGDQKFEQEFETAFIGASNTLISGVKLKQIPVAKPVLTNSFVAVYEKPIRGHSYCMTVDTARGGAGDYSTFVVFDVTQIPYKIVYRYRNNTISSMVYPTVILSVANEYGNCPILVETNDIGESVANALYYDYEYEETIFAKKDVIVSWGGSGSLPGLKTTKKTKRVGCDTLKQLVEQDKLTVNDYEILYELSNFVSKGSSFEAENGNDDLAMCLVMFSYLTTSAKFQEISDASVRERIIFERREAEEAEALPLGFYNDGSEEPDIFNF